MVENLSSKRLSVVVVASNNLNALERTLASLGGQRESGDTEVVAVCNFDDENLRKLNERFPFASIVVLPKSISVPALRSHGIHLSTGEIVAFLEDYGFADERWCAEIKKAHDSGHSVVGGAVENKTPNRLLNWAVYFFDYGRYMLPVAAGAATTLSGINVSYTREVLAEVAVTCRDEFHETFVHEQLKRNGRQLYLAPSVIVYLSKDYGFGDTLRSFFTLARSFASRRVAERAWAERISLALGSCLLPIVLTVRTVLRVVPKKKHLVNLMLCIPHLSLLMTGWAAGEFCGYIFGEDTRLPNKT